MNNPRELILAKIRQNLRSESGIAAEPIAVAPLQTSSSALKPHWDEDDVSRFIYKLESAAATVVRISSEDEIVPAVSAYLGEHDIPLNLVRAGSDLLNKLAWPDNFTVEQRKALGTDATVLTEAYAAVAETGSLVLLSGANSPTSLNFLPDNYLCILRQKMLVKHIEDVWQRLKQEYSDLPRAVNFITGPSRTADVEQTIQLGAHGPRRLHVILLQQ